jgi:hypothetical protein
MGRTQKSRERGEIAPVWRDIWLWSDNLLDKPYKIQYKYVSRYEYLVTVKPRGGSNYYEQDRISCSDCR